MPTNIQVFQVLTIPNSQDLESFPIFITIPANTRRIVTFPTEFNSIAIGLQIENNDSTNAASYRINSSTDVMNNLPASNFRSFSGMNIVSVEVQTGAAGACLISGQMAALPKSEVQENL